VKDNITPNVITVLRSLQMHSPKKGTNHKLQRRRNSLLVQYLEPYSSTWNPTVEFADKSHEPRIEKKAHSVRLGFLRERINLAKHTQDQCDFFGGVFLPAKPT